MTMRIDLHMHSLYSDGELSPDMLVSELKKWGIDYGALTDHDSVEGTEKAVLAADKVGGIHLFPGTELSCVHKGRGFHILGLGIDHRNPTLLNELNYFKEVREERAVKIIEKLREYNWDVDNSVLDKKDGIITRMEIAKAVRNRTISADKFFDKWLGKNCPCFVERERMTVKEAVELIHKTGGKAIWAHPADTLKKDLESLPRIAKEFRSFGLDGVEVFYSKYSEGQTRIVYQVASELGLLMSAGSDFHRPSGSRRVGGYKTYGLEFNPNEIVNSLLNRE